MVRIFIFSIVLVLGANTFAQNTQNKCIELFNPQVALLEKPLSEDLNDSLTELVAKDPELQDFLANPNFVRFLQAVADGKTIEELRPILFELWADDSTQDYALGKKTGALLIGPDAHNNSKLVNLIAKAELKEAAKYGTKEKVLFFLKRVRTQIKNLRQSIARSKALIQEEMNPAALDKNLFDFYGYLNLRLDSSRLRRWETPENSFGGIKLSDVRGIDPMSFIKVLMMASQIENPIHDYSDASGEIFRLYPQVARFMGKTVEQASYHDKTRDNLYCTNSWCEEENRHEGMLENVARRIVGLVLPNNHPFVADKSLDPFNPDDVNFHTIARANNELGASSTYYVLGSHAQGNTEVYLQNIRRDEVKHSTIFAGLYHYLYGDTYWARLKGVVKKTLIELSDKSEGAKSDYGDIFTTEPVSFIEISYAQIAYERQIKKYMSSLPLKTLKKFFETDINLDPLPSEELNPEKQARLDNMMPIEKARREALAGWPKKQRDQAYQLQAFEAANDISISKLIAGQFNLFKGSEEFGSESHDLTMKRISLLSVADLSGLGFKSADKDALELLKKSLTATLRDYQIMNNRNVREQGLKVEFISASYGFEIARDDAYYSKNLIHGQKPAPVIVSQAPVTAVYQITPGTTLIRIKKPAGFSFSAGDAVSITLNAPQGPQTRTLSIANSPQRDYLEFAVRASDSFFKQALINLKPNDLIGLGTPKGALKFRYDQPAVMIAGGIGITPFRGILQKMKDESIRTPVHLVYSNRTSIDTAFRDEFRSLNSNVSVDYLTTQEGSTRIDEAYIRNLVAQSPANAIFYVVAPLKMVQSVKNLLLQAGVQKERISVESFAGYR